MLKQLTTPASEPVTVAQAKLWLKVDTTEDDDLITSLIIAAREYCEAQLDRQLVSTNWRLVLDAFPEDDVIQLPRCPVTSVTSVDYLDLNSTAQVWSVASYIVDTTSEPARITPAYLVVPPITLPVINSISVTFTAGYSTVPSAVTTAMKLLLAHWYENRQQVITGTIATSIPMAVDSLLSSASWGNY